MASKVLPVLAGRRGVAVSLGLEEPNGVGQLGEVVNDVVGFYPFLFLSPLA
jgi:hypothetical protein